MSEASSLGASDWLGLAAAPTCVAMALLMCVHGGGPPDVLCSAARGASWSSGMAPIYALMAAFHSGAWLRLVVRRRDGSPCAVPGLSATSAGDDGRDL